MVAHMKGPFANHVPRTRFDQIQWVAETGSTNQDALAAASAGADEGLVLLADYQSAGRGRLNRTWEAPRGASVLCSVLLRPSLEPDELFLLTAACAVAARQAVAEVTGVELGLKWPNDLIFSTPDGGTRKVAGILAESHVVAGSVDAVVVGMGLNVNWPADLPSDLVEIATALNHLCGHEVERNDIVVAWLTHYEAALQQIENASTRHEFLKTFSAQLVTIGQNVRVETAHETFSGVARGLSAKGHLLVDCDGTEREVTVADVVHLRTDN